MIYSYQSVQSSLTIREIRVMLAELNQLWFTLLYQPLFNALFYIYNTIAHENLGWAVVWLTIFLRIALLPLSIISERNNASQASLTEEVTKSISNYAHDPVAQKQEFRRVMRKHHISPWAKVLTLMVQVVVFLLLYQVFVHGISGERIIKILYAGVDFPGTINKYFYGFDIGRTHDSIWAGIVAGYVFLSTALEHGFSKKWDRDDFFFLIFFPIFIFIFLWFLPMVKSLFILTTLVFSDTISLIGKAFFSPKKAKAQGAHH